MQGVYHNGEFNIRNFHFYWFLVVLGNLPLVIVTNSTKLTHLRKQEKKKEKKNIYIRTGPLLKLNFRLDFTSLNSNFRD